MGYSRALACLRRYSRLLDLGWSWLLASCCYSRLLAPLRHYSRPLDSGQSVTRVYSHTRVSHLLAYSHLLVLVGTQAALHVFFLVTRFSPVLAVTRVHSYVLLLLASTRRSSPLLAITRLYSHTCVYWHWWGCTLPLMCFSLLLAYTRMSSPLLASTRFSPLLASTRMSARMSSLLLACTRFSPVLAVARVY